MGLISIVFAGQQNLHICDKQAPALQLTAVPPRVWSIPLTWPNCQQRYFVLHNFMLSFYLTAQKTTAKVRLQLYYVVEKVCASREEMCVGVEGFEARDVVWFRGLCASMARSTWCHPVGTKQKNLRCWSFFFLPCCTADRAASCWLQLTVLSGSDRGGGEFVLSESTPVLPSGHAHMDECTHTNTYAHACEHGIHQAHARWTSHTYSNSGELHVCEYKRNWNADAWRQERWEICQTFQPCTIHTQKRKYSAKLNVRHQSFIWN